MQKSARSMWADGHVVTTLSQSDENRRRQIRAAAAKCFIHRGFAATRLLDIARESGLSKGAVYFHYRAKEALLRDILDGHLEGLETRWSNEQDSERGAVQKLRRMAFAHFQAVVAAADEARLFNLALAEQPSELREKLSALLDTMRSRYANVLLEDGLSPIDAEKRASVVLAIIYGIVAQSASDKQIGFPLTADEVADTVTGILNKNSPEF